MTVDEIMIQLKEFGSETTKKTYLRHGAKEPLFGVKVEDMKKILKKTKKNHELSLQLFATGNFDAMYLAGLMADETKITEAQLNQWVEMAYWSWISEYAVPWVAAETSFGFDIGLKWIKSEKETTAASGWATLAYFAAVNEDSKLDIKKYSDLLDYVAANIHSAQNRVRYVMNGFVIAIGTHIKELNSKAKDIASKIGAVNVTMDGTSCKVPLAAEYIAKVEIANKVGKKRKTARC
jgi:3-methyladenine DNA glycosylase AlkD